ncbi:MAG: hypothetical protein IT378_14040, partial [Sandaracinaceae bacterium]|nr:hypothetical protein [Sandaracinaceae bacterium]
MRPQLALLTLGGLVLGGLALGCSPERPAVPPPEPEPEPSGPSPSHTPPQRPELPPARLAELSGNVTIAGVAARQGQSIEDDQSVDVPEGGQAALNLRDGGRVVLFGPALGRVVVDGAAEVFVLRGGAHAVLSPMGNAVRPPLRVCTPAVTAEIPRSAELFVEVMPGGATWVSVLSGGASVSDGDADARQQLRASDLVAQQSLLAVARAGEVVAGPGRLEAAREAARALAGQAAPADVPRMRRELGAQVERLDQALRWLETETRRGRDLTTQHRTAVREQRQDDVRRLMRDLVEHSRALYRLRRLATTRWERVRTQALLLASMGETVSPDPVAARLDR